MDSLLEQVKMIHPILSDIPTNYSYWILNMVTTILFIPAHLVGVGILYLSNISLDWALFLWSGIQLLLAVYSYLIIFGNAPIQIALLYVRLPVRIISFLYLIYPVIMFIVTLWSVIYFNGTDKTSAAWTLLYQAMMNGPTIMFLVPFLFYLSDLDTYIASKYPTFYNNTSYFIRILFQGNVSMFADYI